MEPTGDPIPLDLSDFHFEYERLAGGISEEHSSEAQKEYNAIIAAAQEIQNNNPDFAIKFECTAGAVSEFCRVDNVNISSSSSFSGFYKYVYSTIGLTNGSYVYTVYANDSNGNQPIPSIGEFVVI